MRYINANRKPKTANLKPSIKLGVGVIVILVLAFFIGASEAAGTYRIYYSANDGGPNWRILMANLKEGETSSDRKLAIDLGGAGTLDSAHAYSQTVLKEKNGYVMYYGGYDGSNWRILRAISTGGINWVKQGLCLNLGPTGAFDSVHVVYPYVIKEENLYKMWYTAFDGNHWRIGYAVSSDGVIFKNRQIALDTGGSGGLDAEHVHTPVVVKQGGLYTMFYAGYGGKPAGWRILRATSTDGLYWIKQGLALDIGAKEEPDSDELLCGSAMYAQGLFKMWYWAKGTNFRILSATSKNGIDWQKQGVVLDLGSGRSLDSNGLVVPAVIEEKSE